jgi:hypothetical protein
MFVETGRAGVVAAAVVALLVSGCRPPDGPRWDLTAHPVTGVITYDGKPAGGVLVGLLPIDAPLPPAIPANPRATTAEDGSFTITTFRDGDGACVGSYQILLTWAPPAVEGEEAQTDKLLGWYDAVHSPLRFTVAAGANEIPPIEIPARTKQAEELPGIPGRN